MFTLNTLWVLLNSDFDLYLISDNPNFLYKSAHMYAQYLDRGGKRVHSKLQSSYLTAISRSNKVKEIDT